MSFFKQALPFVIPHYILPDYLFLKNHTHTNRMSQMASVCQHFLSFHFIPRFKIQEKAFLGTVFSNKYQNRHQQIAPLW